MATTLSLPLWKEGMQTIKVLLEHGSEISESLEVSRTLRFGIALFAPEDVVRLLLENGADAERDTDWGKKALYKAMHNGNHEIAELLRKHGFTRVQK